MQLGIYPFWFWNSDQEEQETLRQLEMFADINCQGVVLHGREGNQVPYMSEEWLQCIKNCCRKAKELNLKLWLYDEEGYPSGNAGGRIPAEFPELLPKCIDFEYGSITGEVFAAYHPQTLKRITDPGFTGTALCLKKRTGFRHVDVLNKRSCEEFMRRTHHLWEKELKEYFGNVIECVYTDDISIFEGYMDGIPWSDTLPEEYEKHFVWTILSRTLTDPRHGCAHEGDPRGAVYCGGVFV